jgi:hypothetical protein
LRLGPSIGKLVRLAVDISNLAGFDLDGQTDEAAVGAGGGALRASNTERAKKSTSVAWPSWTWASWINGTRIGELLSQPNHLLLGHMVRKQQHGARSPRDPGRSPTTSTSLPGAPWLIAHATAVGRTERELDHRLRRRDLARSVVLTRGGISRVIDRWMRPVWFAGSRILSTAATT